MSTEKKEFKVRIVNKTKDKITLSYGKGNTEEYTWAEFKSAYTIKDGIWAILNDDLVKKREEINEMISDAVAYYIMSQAKDPSIKLDMLSLMGDQITKIQDALECPLIDVINILKQRVDMFKNTIGGNKRKKHNKNKPDRKSADKTADQTHFRSNTMPMQHATTKLGDLPGFSELREKFK